MALAVALASLLLAGTALAGLVPSAAGRDASPLPLSSTAPNPGSGLRAYATWGGTNVSTASSASSALSVSFSSTITLHYYWSSAGAYPMTISDARLQMYYFGYALSTRDVVDSNPVAANNGTFTMTWQAGALAYLLEGTYRLTASLLTPSGGTVWSQDFYVHGSAPADILAAIPILLVLIAIYEVYGLLTSGRAPRPAAPKRPSGTEPPGAPAKGTAKPSSEDEREP